MINLKIPRENANDDFVLVTKVFAKAGDKVNLGDILFEFETSKATVEFEATQSGYLVDFTLNDGMQIPVDSVVGAISESSQNNNADIQKEDSNIIALDYDAYISDAAKQLIQNGEKPVKPHRWITTDNFKESNKTNALDSNNSTVTLMETFSDKNKLPTTFRVVTADKRKQAEIKSLGTTSPYFNSTLGVSIELGKRHSSNDFFSNSILDLVVYEASLLLQSSFSDLNACYVGNNQIAVFDEVIAGVALDNLKNLTVVSLNNFTTLSELSDQIIDVVIKFEDNKLTSRDLQATTFTVTDLSNLGVDFVIPLINGAQGFILGIVKKDNIFQIFGTFDHRITEGKRFSSFLLELKRRILQYEIQPKDVTSNSSCFYCLKTVDEEKLLGNRGLLKIFDGAKEKLICRNCYEGW